MNNPPRLTVYGRSDCHLCDMMVAQLRDFQSDVAFEVEVVEIDGDSVLEGRYGKRVPVLVAGGLELCRYRLDHAKLSEFLKSVDDVTFPAGSRG